LAGALSTAAPAGEIRKSQGLDKAGVIRPPPAGAILSFTIFDLLLINGLGAGRISLPVDHGRNRSTLAR